MPKRSNDFQRLVHQIYMQLAENAVVTESALLKTLDGATREVDVLITYRVADVEMRLAIECRERNRTADVEWIDSLIGKYRDLPVDRVIAVSNQRFTRTARRKAQRSRIEMRTLREALDTDWAAELWSVKPVSVLRATEVLDVLFSCTPPPGPDYLPVEAIVDGVPSSIDALIKDFIAEVRAAVGEQLMIDAETKYRTLDKFPDKLEADYKIIPADVIVISGDNVRRRLDFCIVSAITHIRATVLEPSRSMFDDIAVLHAQHDIPEMHERATVILTQRRGEHFFRMSDTTTKLPSA